MRCHQAGARGHAHSGTLREGYWSSTTNNGMGGNCWMMQYILCALQHRNREGRERER
jgi:hypothetical protein